MEGKKIRTGEAPPERNKKMEKYTIEELLDDALDTSSSNYLDILDAFDGVKATSENEKIWVEVV